MWQWVLDACCAHATKAGREAAADSVDRHQHLLVEMALTLLLRGLKKGTIDRSPGPLAHPLGPHLTLVCRSKQAAVSGFHANAHACSCMRPAVGDTASTSHTHQPSLSSHF